MATNSNGNIELSKKHTILLIVISAISIFISLMQPFIWAAKMDTLQQWQNIRIEAAERKIVQLENQLEASKRISAELKFNIRRLMEDKFGMKYIEDPDILIFHERSK